MGRVRWVVGALVVVLALPLLAAGQGLGDAANKEKGRRAQDQKSSTPTKSFTQEDLKRGAPSSSSPAEPAADAASTPPPPGITSAGEAAADSEEESRKRDEEMWRGRVVDARARIVAARKKHEAMAALNLVPGYEYVDSRGVPLIRSVGELQALTATAKAELDAAERALEELLEQARHARVPPGWLR